MNLACLIIWSILCIMAVYDVYKNEPVHPLSYFCATFVCFILYAEKVLIG